MKQVLFLLMVSSLSTQGQVKISSISYKVNEDSFSFPFIKSADKNLAQTINSFLQNDILDNSRIETNPKKIFENVRFKKHQGGMTWIDYLVEANNSRFFSIKFQFETMAAYPSSYNSYYSFDLKTGELINTKKLFTTLGIEQIKKLLISERQKLIDKEIYERSHDAADTDYVKDTALIRERFTECNEEADEESIFILKNSVLFYKEGCMPHVIRAYDIDLNIELSFEEIKKYFTPYARELFASSKKRSVKN